jgi:hypothetical protein
VDFDGLVVGVSRGDALAEGLEAAHPSLGAAADVVSRPPFPERPAVVTRSAQGFVARVGGWAIFLPRSAIPADGDARARAVPRAWDQQRDVLQVAGQVWRHGCIDPAEPAQVKPLKRMPRRGFSCPAPDVSVGGCRS